MTLVQIAEEFGGEPAEAAVRLYARGEAAVILHAMQEPDMETIASHPLIAVGSDGSSLSTEGLLSVGRPHPRSNDTNPRFLAFPFCPTAVGFRLTTSCYAQCAMPGTRSKPLNVRSGACLLSLYFAEQRAADTCFISAPGGLIF